MGLLGWCLSTLRVFAFPNTKTRFQYKPYEASLFEIILLISKPSWVEPQAGVPSDAVSSKSLQFVVF